MPKTPETATAYEWDFDGEWAPHQTGVGPGKGFNHSFSLGVFQWVPRANGKGLKRGKVFKRFHGMTWNADPCYAKAKALVDELNAKK